MAKILVISDKYMTEMVSCACGCGIDISKYSKYGRVTMYAPSHQLSKSREMRSAGRMGGSKKGQVPWNKGIKMSDSQKVNYSLRRHTQEQKRKIGLSHIGEKNINWKGGISKKNEVIRGSIEMREFTRSVKKRDNNICQKCLIQKNTKKTTAHHILNFSTHVDLRFDINNGITFCIGCHKLFHGTYGYKNNNTEQLKEFITPSHTASL